MTKNKEFWIANISNRNVTLSDLSISIRAGHSINLLDPKQGYHTEEQCEKSLASGSLFLKRHLIKKRVIPPAIVNGKVYKIAIDNKATVPSKPRSIYEVKVTEYEELKLSSEEEDIRQKEFESIAAEVDEMTELDRAPLIAKDPK